jgi:DNA-binding response OmpR family regulator
MTRVLIVEDDDELRFLLVEALDDLGYSVTGAEHSAAALEVAQRSQFDLIITDVRMEGLDGLELLLALRDSQPSARSIVITGYASTDAPVRAIKAHAEDYLHKPFTIKALTAAIRRVLGAEHERKKYGKLLSALASGYRRLAELATSDAGWMAVERTRHQSYRAFYVGVRSGFLQKANFAALWNRLYELEVKRCSVKDLSPELGRKLVQGFQHVIDLIAALEKNPTRLAEGTSRVPVAAMQVLAERVVDGSVSLEQLKLAHLLYSAQNRPELAELRSQVWGA